MIVQPARLRHGNGNPKDGLCLMQMVDWFAGHEKVSDAPACACPVLTVIGIRLNDTAPSDEARDSLWPLVWRLLDSRDPGAEQLRAKHIVREVTRRIVAPLFDTRLPGHAAALRSAQSMQDIEQAAKAARTEANAVARKAAAEEPWAQAAAAAKTAA